MDVFTTAKPCAAHTAAFENMSEAALDHLAALAHRLLAFHRARLGQRLAIEPQSLGVGNRILQLQTEKAHEGEAITKLVFRLIVGEIVERLQHQRLEDHDFIPRLASRRILAFRFAPAKFALNQRRIQLWPEGFKGNHRPDRHKRIVLFGETFIASVQIEEATLSHANLPRSEHEKS